MAKYCIGCEASTMDFSGFKDRVCDDCFDKALLVLDTMPDEQFNRFLQWTPARVQMLVRGKMVEWRDVLPSWYVRFETEFIGAKNFHNA